MFARNALLAIVLAVAALLPVGRDNSALAANGCAESVVNVVAHEDDDLLFLNPDVRNDIVLGKCVMTIFVTAGDGGGTQTAVFSREEGIRSSYAQMAGQVNAWSASTLSVTGQVEQRWVLDAAQNVSVVFLRLPDGNLDGSGFPSTGYQSLQKLWDGRVTQLTAIDAHSTYSRSALIGALDALFNFAAPSTVRSQAYSKAYGTGDHSDHISTGKFAHAAASLLNGRFNFTAYKGYDISSLAANLTATEISPKQAAFFNYAQYDSVCKSVASCVGTVYEPWLSRRYVLSSASNDRSFPINVAMFATATASSENGSLSQYAIKALDGAALGAPTDADREWATTAGGGVGTWLDVRWNAPIVVDRVVLFDRPNLTDNIASGTLAFSDGTSVAVGALFNSGSATVVTFPARSVTGVRFTVSGVSTSTTNVGLAEFQVWSSPTASTTTTSTAAPTTTTIPTTNVAPAATAIASTQNTAALQTANKAIDGSILGYPDDSTKEWATIGQRAGAWLDLTWPGPQIVNRITFHDRPNTADNITSAIVTFSDGSTINVPTLNNAGGATSVSFSARSITSLRMTVTGTSPSTGNVGLAEIKVWGNSTGATTTSTTSTSTTSTTTTTTTTTTKPTTTTSTTTTTKPTTTTTSTTTTSTTTTTTRPPTSSTSTTRPTTTTTATLVVREIASPAGSPLVSTPRTLVTPQAPGIGNTSGTRLPAS